MSNPLMRIYDGFGLVGEPLSSTWGDINDADEWFSEQQLLTEIYPNLNQIIALTMQNEETGWGVRRSIHDFEGTAIALIQLINKNKKVDYVFSAGNFSIEGGNLQTTEFNIAFLKNDSYLTIRYNPEIICLGNLENGIDFILNSVDSEMNF